MVGASVALPPASSTELDNSPAGQYTTQEKLLLAQAVYKVGAIAWPVVSTLLTEHPLIRDRSRPTELFSAQSCEAAYIALMRSIGQNV
jgi:bromodomain-containing protein 8